MDLWTELTSTAYCWKDVPGWNLAICSICDYSRHEPQPTFGVKTQCLLTFGMIQYGYFYILFSEITYRLILDVCYAFIT